jgi:hypothetical protein
VKEGRKERIQEACRTEGRKLGRKEGRDVKERRDVKEGRKD